MTARRAALALSTLALALAASAAPGGCARSEPCQLNSDCAVGYCLNGACQKNCVIASRDCPAGFTCDQNAQCVPGAGTGGSSTSSSSGAGAGTSSSGSSGTGATTTTSSSAGGGGATSSSSTTSSGAGAGTSSSSSTTSTTSSTSGGAGNHHELDLCAVDSDCASPLVCRPMTPGGTLRCTPTCSSSAACATGTICVTLNSSMYCAADDTGRLCNAAATCNFACLTSQQYCTKTCGSGSDCPNGYGCMTVSGQNVCVKAEAPCAMGDTAACIAPAACDTSAQMVVGGCTTVCNSAADCPQRAAGLSPWTCDAGGICRRPSDVYGPLQNGATPAQYACDAAGTTVNVCNDDQHIDYTAFDIPPDPVVSCTATTTTAGIATDSCVDSCRYQGGCPWGFGCVALGSLGTGRIGLCLPEGIGEVSAACTHHSDCAFGYCAATLGKCSRDCTADGICPDGTTCTAAGGPDVEGQPFRRCQ